MSLHHPGYSHEGKRVWPVLELCTENLRMRMDYRKETAKTLASKMNSITEDYIFKLALGKRKNPTQKVIQDLEMALECFFVTF